MLFYLPMTVDIDECATDNAGCGQICVNLTGSYECKCNAGYLLAEDAHACTGKTFQYMDEIQSHNLACLVHSVPQLYLLSRIYLSRGGIACLKGIVVYYS